MNMRNWLWIIILFSSVFLACNQKKSNWEIQQELLLHKRDSLKNTDVTLSFMGIDIGGSVDKISEAIKQEKIKIDSCADGIYIGTVVVPCIKDTTTFDLTALMRIGTLKNKVASIELVFKSDMAFDFFNNTFNERYYESDFSEWYFKEQTLSINKKTHKEIRDVVVGRQSGKNVWEPREVDIVDAISVEYIHNDLDKQLQSIISREKNLKERIENEKKELLDKERKDKADKIEKEYRKNI